MPRNGYENSIRQHGTAGVVLFSVLNVALVVLISVFNHGQNDNNDQSRHYSWRAIGIRNCPDGLQTCDHQVVYVCRLAELLEQIHWQERENAVLRRLYHVSCKFLLGCFQISHVNVPCRLFDLHVTTIHPH